MEMALPSGQKPEATGRNYISPGDGGTGRAGRTNWAGTIIPAEVTGRGGAFGGAGRFCCLPQAFNANNNTAPGRDFLQPAENFCNRPPCSLMIPLSSG
jgi:hypothetical protein